MNKVPQLLKEKSAKLKGTFLLLQWSRQCLNIWKA